MTAAQLSLDAVSASKQGVLEQLKKKLLADTLIADLAPAQTAQQLVWGDGNAAATVMLVGEAPGATEDRLGKPFVGRAGRLLDECLTGIGLSRLENVWITNLVKHRPPANRDPLPQEKAAYAPYLKREISIIKPRVLVALGRHAGSHFIADLHISRQHGQVQAVEYSFADGQQQNLWVMPIYHPAAALYNPQLLPQLKQDFLNLKEILIKL